MPRIAFQSVGFPAGTIANGSGDLTFTWDDFLWAAITVGRPNRQFVFKHGASSMYEALFRWSLVRMALEQKGPTGFRLRRTEAAKTLDPTEKGAVNYFIGMAVCKLFASKLLNTPWLLHLDVFRPSVNAVLRGRSRPDMVGQESATGKWYAFECKGRASPPDATAKSKAKTQAGRVASVGGAACTMHIGAITYLRNDVLQFYWEDPEPRGPAKLRLPYPVESLAYYYGPFAALLRESTLDGEGRAAALLARDGAGLSVSAHPAVKKHLIGRDWEAARTVAEAMRVELAADGFQPDGLRVEADASWLKPYRDLGAEAAGAE